MFTGIISGTGKLISLKKSGDPVILISAGFEKKPGIGDSVSINGVCLTVISISNDEYSFNVSGETLSVTTFPDLRTGDLLNLELPVTPDGLMGGHIVSGHIDGTARLRRSSRVKGSLELVFSYSQMGWKKFLIPKGSIAVNGVSLTLNEISSSFFTINVIPHTLEKTNLKLLKSGERVNIELDLIAKYLYNIKLNMV